MLNYEEYFLHEQNGDFKYDYQVMAEMLLNKNVDEKYWIQISAFELMDYMYVLCAFYEESMAEEFKSKEYKMKIHMRYIKNVFPKDGFTQQQLLYTIH